MWICFFQFTRAIPPNQAAEEAWRRDRTDSLTLRTGQQGLQTDEELVDDLLFSGDFLWGQKDLDKEMDELRDTLLPLAFPVAFEGCE